MNGWVVEGTTGPGPGPKLELSGRATGLATGDTLSPVREQPGHCWRVGCRRNTSGTAAVQVPSKARAPVIPPRDCVSLSRLSSPWSCATLPTPRHAWNCQPAMTTRGLMTDGKHQAGINTTINQQQLQDRPKLWALDLLAIRLGSQTKIQDQVQILRKFPLAACDRTNGPPLGPLFSFSALLSSFVFSALSALGWVASGPLELNRPP